MPELPKIVTQRLQTTPGDHVHPDPDLITAFVENALPPEDRNQILAHLSGCSDCREIVSFALPEYAAEIPVAVRSVGSRWLSWPVLRWGALTACVVVVGAAIMLRHESRLNSPEIPAQAPQARTLDQKAPQSPAPAAQARNQLAYQSSGSARDGLSAAPSTRLKKETPAAHTNEPSPIIAGERRPDLAENKAADVATVAEATPSPSIPSMNELVPGRAKDVPLESRAANGTAVSGGPMVAKSRASVSAMAMSKAAYPSPLLVPRWTLTSDGILQRSLDSGTTWEAVSVSGQASLRALAANGLDIWVGGSNGALYHSSDAGQHWTQVRPVANGELLSADIIGVEFTDLQHGTLTTSAKETWVTADAGQSWLKK